MIVRLNQKRMIRQHIQQQILCRIHNSHDPSARQPLHDRTVNIIRHRGRDTACQHKDVTLLQPIQPLHELCDHVLADVRTVSVDLGALDGLQLHIDT